MIHDLQQQYESLSQSLHELLQKSGRAPSSCRILAVSKARSADEVRLLFSHGQRDFAENYWQEAQSKQAALKDCDIEWHFIGSLQSNKIKAIAENFSWIHSVARLSHLEKLTQIKFERHINILIQVNLAGETTKDGCSRSELNEILDCARNLPPGVRLRGLMLMPPLTVEPLEAAQYFSDLQKIASDIRNQRCERKQWDQLSMGTSLDWRYAVEHGATWIRLGTILFGPRSSKKA